MFNVIKAFSPICGDVVYSPLGIPPTIWLIILIVGGAVLITVGLLLGSKFANEHRNRRDSKDEREERK